MADFCDMLNNAIKVNFPHLRRAKCYDHLWQNRIKTYTKTKYEHLQEYMRNAILKRDKPGKCSSDFFVDFGGQILLLYFFQRS